LKNGRDGDATERNKIEDRETIMEGKKTMEIRRNSRHGSTGFFLMLDYIFLTILLCFLYYFLVFQIWSSTVSSIVPFTGL
jgi:hypothetical protein